MWQRNRLRLAGLKFFVPIALLGLAPAFARAEEPSAAALVTVSVNGQAAADPELVFWLAPDDDVCVPLEGMARLRVSADGLPLRLIEKQSCAVLRIEGGIRARFDSSRQALALEVPPKRLPVERVELQPVDLTPLARSAVGGFLNYDLMMAHGAGDTSLGAALTGGLFLPGGHGDSSVVVQFGRASRVIRLETRWTIDEPERMRSWRLGDAIARGAAGVAPFRFAGIQLTRSFATQPGFLTFPLSAISGAAALPSVADLYVNDVLQSRFKIRPGPFTVSDVPLVSGDGQVRLVVHDLLGRDTVISERYYSAPQLLRRGLADYSFEAGFLRRGFSTESFHYGEPFAATTQRYGLSDRVTGEFHAAVSPHVQQAAATAWAAWPTVGMITASATASRSGGKTGGMIQLGFERRSPRLSYGAVVDWANDLVTLDSVPQGKQGARIRAYAGGPTAFGSFGVSYTDTLDTAPTHLRIFSTTASVRVRRFTTVNLLANYIEGARDAVMLRAALSVPLGRTSSAIVRARTGLYGQELAVGYRRQADPAGGWGFGADANAGPFPRVAARAEWRTDVAAFDGALAVGSGTTAIRLGATGSLGLLAGTPFAARRLGSSFGIVDVNGLANVRVYADNVLIGRSGANGRMIIPELRAFEVNSIRIEGADVPLDAELVRDHVVVRPPEGRGLVIQLAEPEESASWIEVRLENGSPLPTGARVTTRPANRSLRSLRGGHVHAPLRAGRNTIIADFGTRRCEFELVVPRSGKISNFGPLMCRGVER